VDPTRTPSLVLGAFVLGVSSRKRKAAMDELEWMTSEDWRPMLAHVSGRLSRRKARLYVCAGLRSLWDLLFDESSRQAVELAERDADGFATSKEIDLACFHAESPTFGYDFDAAFVREQHAENGEHSQPVRRLLDMGVYTEEELATDGRLGSERVRSSLINAAHIAYHNLTRRISENDPADSMRGHLLEHLSSQEEWPEGWLVREIVGNPFCPVLVPSTWLRSNDETVAKLAQIIYDGGAFEMLPILGDALEDAGCTDASILTHCRESGPHVRGCWVIDLLTGRK
jgi:hypothetical protein